MQVPALERCVGDVGIFFSTHWGRAPLLLTPSSEDERGFSDLASLDDLDHMIASLGLHASSLRMVRDGTTLPVSGYTTPAAKTSRGMESLVSAAAVYQRFMEGATIVLESLHRYWKPLAGFCRELEISLGHRLQVNAYITPPGSRGFDVHRDTHDVFVLQVSGTKHWIVYDRDDDQQVLIDRDIEAGSSLYIPTGFPHAAATGGTTSAHLTVGILTHDSIEVVRGVAGLAEEEPAFRQRLPGAALRDVGALRAEVDRQLEEVRCWLEKVDVDELTRRVARRVMSSAQPILGGRLRQFELLEAIDADTPVTHVPGATCFLWPNDGGVTVLLADRELEMPVAAVPAMELIAVRKRFHVRDLHEFLTPASSLILVRRLIREGLLEVLVED